MNTLNNNKYSTTFKHFKSDFSARPVLKNALEQEKLQKKRNLKKALVLTASVGGALAGLLYVGKKQNVDVFTKKGYGAVDYDAQSIIAIASGSLLGGTGVGIVSDKKNAKPKLREGIQLLVGSILFPILTIAGGNRLYEKYGKNIKIPQLIGDTKFIATFNRVSGKLPKIATVGASFAVGMLIGNKVGSLVNNAIFKDNHESKLDIADAVASVDDIGVSASFATKGASLGKVIQKFIPPALVVPGFVAGTKEAKISP